MRASSGAQEVRPVPTPDSEYLRTTPKAVRRLIERGRLPGIVRVGRRVLFRRDRLLRFLAESSVPSPWETKR